MKNTLNTKNTGNIILGQNIRDIRKNLHLTQEDFAEKLNINANFLSQIETGKTGISIDNLINICNVAKCSPTHLFKGLIQFDDIMDKYQLLNHRNKSIINQMIDYLINTN